MKKVININFQGRVVPIEESAYDILKQYIESLRRYFANEEGRDEIINDIESRIAELFSERIKKGSTCITEEDVNTIAANMGRPADFEAQEAESGFSKTTQQDSSQQKQYTYAYATGRGKLYRNADDKIIGGVCSGLANYLGIDPVVMRILFVVFIGALIWVYILLWIIVPSQSIQSNITKRLYRNPDDKVIAGVCGGLASYFNIDTWIPRLIFALPIILGLISGGFDAFFWNWDFGFVPRMVSGSLGFTLFVTYVILWIAVPPAVTAAEKLEMKGEKIDLNSIRNTVKEDLETFKSRAEKFGSEVKQTAQQFGEKAKEFGQGASTQARAFAAEAAPLARRTGSGIGHVIGILFKAFFLFIAGIIAVTLFFLFVGLLFGGMAIFPLKNFVLEGFWQNFLAWGTLLLFIGVPIIGLITWLVRRIMGVRSKNRYLGYVFGSLWIVGIICAILLAGFFARNFRTRSAVEETIQVVQPSNGKIYLDVKTSNVRYYGGDWFGVDWDEDWPFYGINQDTLMLNTVRVNLVKSKDSLFHLYKVKFSRGRNPDAARQLAEKIDFDVEQNDSLLLLSKGFAISKNEKFRNQQILLVIEIPVGKRIQLDRSITSYDWFSINYNRRRGGWNIDGDDNWHNSYGWESNVEYIMTTDGLERIDNLDENELKRGKFKLKIRDDNIEFEGEFDNGEDKNYRYPSTTDSQKIKTRDSIRAIQDKTSRNESEGEAVEESQTTAQDFGPSLSVFSRLFQ